MPGTIFTGNPHVETSRLADLRPGQTGIVTAVAGSGRLAVRLMELGLVPGATVQVLRKAPFGDPVQYRVRGTVISMRSAEAACVMVSNSADSPQTAALPDSRSESRLAMAVS